MKFSLLVICLLAGISGLTAQTLYTTTTSGGEFGGGTLSGFVGTENSLTVLKSFGYTQPRPMEVERFVLASDGKLYGTSITEGNKGNGFIFSFDPISKIFINLHDFDGPNGSNPSGSLVQANDGKLYGVTNRGGTSNHGVIFSFDPVSSAYSKLKDFSGTDGRSANGPLIQASDGRLYGLTQHGGRSDFGVLFSFDPGSAAYTILLEFNGTNGKRPVGSLVQASDGQLYGMTKSDQITQEGLVIFSFNTSTKNYSVIKEIEDRPATNPQGRMVLAYDGKLYGVLIDIENDDGANSLFSFDPASAAFTILKTFQRIENLNDGIMLASNGKIYGMTRGLGNVNGDYGSVFSYDPRSSTYNVELVFDEVRGSMPYGALTEGPSGKFYGVTSSGGVRNNGLFFSLDMTTKAFSKEWEVGTNESGSRPTGSLTVGPDKKIYGMTTYGGSMGYGTIFSYDLATSTFTKLKDFDFDNGANPQGGLLLAKSEILYGMTTNGGSSDAGVIFSYNIASSTYSKLKDFTGIDGAGPVGNLIQASNDKLYGMTRFGGGGRGVIFSYDPKDSTFRNLHTFIKGPGFDRNEGTNPFGSLLEANGRLYGLTSKGGRNTDEGTLFCFDLKSSTLSLLHNFYNNGREPHGSLIQANDGKLYGMARTHGKFNRGVIFSHTPSQWNSYQVLHDFNQSDGSYPYGDLIQASNGKFYGVTSEGGSSGLGVIFSYDLSSRSYVKLKDFDGKNGSFPLYGSRFLEVGDIPENDLPILSGIGNKSVNELQGLKFAATATDSDGPADTLSFSLGNPANGTFPEGATINKKTGQFSWTPTEVQGPGTYRVQVIVSDGIFTDEEEIEIAVLETATHPVMAFIGAKNVNEGTQLTFTAIATDADLPASPLRFSLIEVPGTNFPKGATIDAESGKFIWTPDELQGPGEYCLKVMVSDGECTDEEKILITVNEVNFSPSFTKGPDVSLFDESRRQVINRWAKNISAGTLDEKDQLLTFVVSNNNQQLFAEQPSISPDGSLTFATVTNMFGVAKVSVYLNDSGGTAFGGYDKSEVQTFLITVNTADINLFAYPNPFGKNATVGFTLPAHEDLVTLDLNDLKGARLQRIYEGKGEANQTKSFTFDGSNYSPGIYFLRLVTVNHTKTFRIIMAE